MADYYTCIYSCRYASEIIYALRQCRDIKELKTLKVLSFGCGPCTDLFAIDYLHNQRELQYDNLEYRGIDYCEDVWRNVHSDVLSFNNESVNIQFIYEDACSIVETILSGNGEWIPDLIVFQYFFSDMHKHTGIIKTREFVNHIANYCNKRLKEKSYVILNDVNLDWDHQGGRNYFDLLSGKIPEIQKQLRKGHFYDKNSIKIKGGYPYGDEFPDNTNFFPQIRTQMSRFSLLDTCASAQMIIKKVEEVE